VKRYKTYLTHEIKEENVELLNKQQWERIRCSAL
jgi:hypothetical protein